MYILISSGYDVVTLTSYRVNTYLSICLYLLFKDKGPDVYFLRIKVILQENICQDDFHRYIVLLVANWTGNIHTHTLPVSSMTFRARVTRACSFHIFQLFNKRVSPRCLFREYGTLKVPPNATFVGISMLTIWLDFASLIFSLQFKTQGYRLFRFCCVGFEAVFTLLCIAY